MSFLSLYVCFLLCISVNAWRIQLLSSDYDPSLDASTYVYELADASSEACDEAIIVVPSCTEIEFIDVAEYSVAGVVWNGAKVAGSQFEIKVRGFMKSELIDYTIETAAGTLGGKVNGPICESIPILSCDAGEDQSASCGGRAMLSGQASQHANQYSWTTNEPGVTIHQEHSAEPTVLVPADMCDHTVVVYLNIVGPEGQTAECQAYVTVQDTEPPQLLGLYAMNVTVDCDDIPAASLVTATDNCGSSPAVSYSETTTGGTITRTWSAEDHCGLTTSHVQEIFVTDNISPTLVGVPDDETFSCHVLPPPCDVLVFDNCDTGITVSESVVKTPGSCDNSYTLLRTWTAVDSSGMSVSDSQVVVVEDVDPPRLVGVPGDMEIHCGTLPDVPDVTAIDNCATNIPVTDNEVRVDLVHPISDYRYRIERTFSAYDRCGNVGEKTWVIDINDVESPTISGVDPDRTVNCAEIPPPCEVAVVDNCDPSVSVVMIEFTAEGDCANSYTMTRRWTAVDVNGNAAEEDQIIHVVDTVKPRFTTSIAPELFASCDFIPTSDLEATDACGLVTVLKTTEEIPGISDVHYKIIHTWIATDECGLTNTKTQTIHVEDSLPPTMSGLPSAHVSESCTADINDPLVVVTDNCPGCDVSLDKTVTRINGTCENEYILERSWTATDCGGHSVSYIQSINIVDTEAPKLIGLSGHLTVPVGFVPDAAVVTATDNCDSSVIVTETEVPNSGTCDYEYVLVRTWEATDNCGNFVNHIQSVSVIDNQPPVFNDTLENIDVSCDQVTEVTLTATDNSGEDITVTMTETIAVGTCLHEYTLYRHFTASDICGNVVTQIQTVTVYDHDPPMILPGDNFNTLIYVDSFEPVANKLASDQCDPNVIVVPSEETIPEECSTKYQVIYTWEATDDCGNTANPLEQIVIVYDAIAPTFNVEHEDVTVECDAIPPVTEVTATDSDGTVAVVTYSETTVNQVCLNSYQIIRTWRSEDCAENVNEHRQTITVVDTTDPQLTNPPDHVEVSCLNIPEGSPTDVTPSDNCLSSISVAYTEVIVGDAVGDYSIVRTWETNDGCGNEESVSQVITVLDDVPPSVIGAPADMSLDCDDNLPTAPTASCSDDCDVNPNPPTFEEIITNYDECINNVISTVIRSWTCTDSLNNDQTEFQTITVVDTLEPVVTWAPVHLTIPCDSPVPSPEVGPTFLPSCGSEVTATFTSRNIPGTTVNDYRVVHTWTTTDSCGHETNTEQTITVEDILPPTLVAPPSETLDCQETFVRPTLIPDDNCDADPSVSAQTETEQGTCTDRYTVQYTWGSTDVSGNTGHLVYMQQIVDDTEVPTFVAPEVSITISYTDISLFPRLQLDVTDNCDPFPTSVCERTKTDGDCPHEFVLVDTCLVSDRCNNNDTVSRTIHVIDDVPPQIGGGAPVDATYECPHAVPNAPQLTSEVGIDVTYNFSTIAQSCANTYDIERIWTAVDCVHNEATVTQTISMQDTTPPVLSPIPGDITRDCPFCFGEYVEEASNGVTATDSCDTSVHVEEVHTTTTENLVGNEVKKYIRTFIATDLCSNSVEGTQTITIVDEHGPEIVNAPVQVNTPVNPHSIPPVPTNVQCVDACDGTVISFSEDTITDTCINKYSIVRNWICRDNMGHESSTSHTIYVDDLTPPVLGPLPLPADVTVSANHIPAIPSVVAEDAVDNAILVHYSQVNIAGADESHFKWVRSWTGADKCGNAVEHVQTITVAPAPETLIPTVPPHTTAECDSVPDANDDTVVTDSITSLVAQGGVQITLTRTTIDGSCSGDYTVVRTWTAEDTDGNTISDFQTIDVSDYTPPEFGGGLPAEYRTVECGTEDLTTIPALTATDNCGGATVEWVETKTCVEEDACIEYSLTRTWIATDTCGNQKTHTAIISVIDSTPPVFSVAPSNFEYTSEICDYPCTFMGDEIIEVVDTCGSASFECESNWDIDECVKVQYIHCVASDVVGNLASHDFSHTYTDVDPPVISNPPAHLSIDCKDPVPEPPNVTVTEPCQIQYTASSTSEYIVINGLDTIVRTWTAQDSCGHTSDVDQTITLTDSTPPVLYDIPQDTTVTCDNPDVYSDVKADDDCGGEVSIVQSVLRSDGECVYNYTLVATWVATDSSGLTSTGQTTIVVEDTEPPILVGLPSSDFENIDAVCSLVPDPPTDVTVVDNCDPLADYTYSQDMVTAPLGPGEEYMLIRIWTATDECENSVEFVQTVHVLSDDIAPVLSSLPYNIHADCDDPVVTEDPTVTDNCDDSLSVTKTEVTEDVQCANEYNIIREWTVTDSHGNTARVDQTVFVTDDAPPALIGIPDNTYSSCSNIPPVPDMQSVDQCGQDSTVSVSSRNINVVNSANYDLVYTWTATDPCGNAFIDEQTIHVQDTTRPQFSVSDVPSDVTVTCDSEAPAVPTLEATDLCDSDVDVTINTTNKDYECSNRYIRHTTWTATDDSGNYETVSWTVTVTDDIPPTFVNLDPVEDITVYCEETPPPTIEADDNCAHSAYANIYDNSIADDLDLSAAPEVRDVIERTYIVSDNCGNDETLVHTITVIDNLPPVLSGIPNDIAVPCSNTNLELFDNHDILIHDDCTTGTVSEEHHLSPGTCDAEYTKTYTFTGHDENGNSVVGSFVVTIFDDVPPTLHNIPQWSHDVFECDSLPSPEETSVVTADDLCAGPLDVDFSTTSTAQSNSVFTYSITFVWNVVDDCGNSDSRSTTIQVDDTTDPTMVCPNNDCADRTVECGGVPNPAQIVSEDNCDSFVTETFDEQTLFGSCDTEYSIFRSWSATDGSGNTNVLEQTITVQSTVPPVLTFAEEPTDVVVSCLAVPIAPAGAANHDCQDVSVIYSEERTNGSCPHHYSLTRTWSVVDCTGLSDEHVQIIDVQDNSEPVLSDFPADVTVEFENIRSTWPGMLTAADDCAGVVPVSFTQSKEPGTCKNSFILIRLWTAEDFCGNVFVWDQTVTVTDTTPPELHGTPLDTYVEYDELKTLEDASLDGVTATDNSNSRMTILVDETTVEGSCATTYTLVRTWTVQDPCGNSDDEEQIINVIDTNPPDINLPGDETVECDAVPVICEVKVDSPPGHPDHDLPISQSQVTLLGNTLFSYRLVRTWWVTDCAGNGVTHEQIITVEDTTPPVFTRTYHDETAECDCETNTEHFQIDALDNCDGPVMDITPEMVIDHGSSPDFYTVYRTWTTQDSTGNVALMVQTVTVQDLIPPTWCEGEELPATLLYQQCDSVPPHPEIKAQDECDPEVAVTYTENTIVGDCADTFTLERHWTAFDRSGNSISHTSTIQVFDSIAPTLINIQEKLCLWPDNGMVAVYNHASESLIDVVDNCGSVETSITSCNSTEPTEATSCHYNAVQDILYVKIEQTSGAGRTYSVSSTNRDQCDNTKVGKKKIWIAYSQDAYNAAVDAGECSGTGADHYISSMPPSN